MTANPEYTKANLRRQQNSQRSAPESLSYDINGLPFLTIWDILILTTHRYFTQIQPFSFRI